MKKVICILALFVFVVSCKKEKHDITCVDGHIEWTGDPAADGTGWVLVEDNDSQTPRRFVLRDLSTEFQESGLPVNACVYETDEKVVCYCPEKPVRYKYAITSIKRR